MENSILLLVSVIPLASEDLFSVVRKGNRLGEVQLPEVQGVVNGKAGPLLNSLVKLCVGLTSNLT